MLFFKTIFRHLQSFKVLMYQQVFWFCKIKFFPLYGYIFNLSYVSQVEKKNSLQAINVREALIRMRSCRMGLIQTADQLRFSYLAILQGAHIILAGAGLESVLAQQVCCTYFRAFCNFSVSLRMKFFKTEFVLIIEVWWKSDYSCLDHD